MQKLIMKCKDTDGERSNALDILFADKKEIICQISKLVENKSTIHCLDARLLL